MANSSTGESFCSRIRTENITAARDTANIIKAFFGPLGPKMLVDCTGAVTMKNNGSSTLRMSDVDQPAVRILADLAQLQDQEMGDGTTSVVLLANELLKNAHTMAATKMYPSSIIISAYRLACKEACRYIEQYLVMDIRTLGRESVVNAAKTAMSSKITTTDADFFAEIVVRAAETLKIETANSGILYAVKSIHVIKTRGASVKESKLVSGYVLNCSIASPAAPRKIIQAKIACLNFSLQKDTIYLHVQATDPLQLRVREKESDITKEIIQKLLNAGANVILSTGDIDELPLKYLVKAQVMTVERCRKRDLMRIAKATGATLLSSFVNTEGKEIFNTEFLGEAGEVSVKRLCDKELITVRRPQRRKWSSIVLRGPNERYLEQLKRSLHDALLVTKRVLESQKVVAGGGSIEAALSVHLENFSVSMSSREQLIIREYAKSMLVVPRTLALNAGLEVECTIDKLRDYHYISQTKQHLSHLKWRGMNFINDKFCDNMNAGVVEPAVMKIQALETATEAVIAIIGLDSVPLNPKSSAKVNKDEDN